jgi:hypothetical protein
MNINELFLKSVSLSDVSWTPSSISSTHAGGSPSRIKGPLVDKYQLVDLLEYSVSTP